ncbi:MAG: CoA-binding protein, partial [Vicinamibacteria bacterium]
VIGASRKESSIGFQILDNLLKHGFQGPVYPINPRATSIHSIAAYPRVGDVPGPVDLAIVVVPKEQVLAVVRESVDAGVAGFVVISAGFREIGGEGSAREAALLEIVRSRGLRMIGPNCRWT